MKNFFISLLGFRFSLREYDLKYKEEDDHRHSACDKCHKDVINSRNYIGRCDGHPQVVESIADQGDRYPRNEIPHCLINRIPVAFKCNIPLKGEIDALRHKGIPPLLYTI